MKGRILSIILSLSLLLSTMPCVFAATDSPSLRMDSIAEDHTLCNEVSPGDIISIRVYAPELPMASLQFSINYDTEVFEYVSHTTTDGTHNNEMLNAEWPSAQVHPESAGRIMYAMASGNNVQPLENWSILTVTFCVKDNAPSTETPITMADVECSYFANDSAYRPTNYESVVPASDLSLVINDPYSIPLSMSISTSENTTPENLNAGDEITVLVQLPDLEIASLQFSVCYDQKVFEYVQHSASDPIHLKEMQDSGWPTPQINIETDGQVRYAIAAGQNILPSSEWTIFSLTLRVKDNVAAQKAIITMKDVECTYFQSEEDNLPTQYESVKAAADLALAISQLTMKINGIEDSAPVNLRKGETITVSIHAPTLSMASLQFVMQYDTNIFEYISHSSVDNAYASDMLSVNWPSAQTNATIDGQVRYAMASGQSVVSSASWALLTVTLRVKNDAPESATSLHILTPECSYFAEGDSWNTTQYDMGNQQKEVFISHMTESTDNDYAVDDVIISGGTGTGADQIPNDTFDVTVSISNTEAVEDMLVMVSTYDETGRFTGFVWQPVSNLTQGDSTEVTFTVDNSSGLIEFFKIFMIGSFTDPLPMGSAYSSKNDYN